MQKPETGKKLDDARLQQRTSRTISESLDKRLAAYALAATAAAGLGLMGAATPAMADIVTYTPTPPFTAGPAKGFVRFSSHGVPLLGFSEAVNAGRTDMLAGSATHTHKNPYVALVHGAVPGGSILKLSAGEPIGPGDNFKFYGLMEGRTAGGSLLGKWTTPGAGYMGLSFFESGKSYFGWAKLSNSVTSKGRIVAKVDEVAIDTTPRQTIDAGQTSTVPEPGTLSLLALGAIGLLMLRKRLVAQRS
ncbi:MAG: PEP-CTERM sorting domain-containing protein [Terriglobia bacterium]